MVTNITRIIEKTTAIELEFQFCRFESLFLKQWLEAASKNPKITTWYFNCCTLFKHHLDDWRDKLFPQ